MAANVLVGRYDQHLEKKGTFGSGENHIAYNNAQSPYFSQGEISDDNNEVEQNISPEITRSNNDSQRPMIMQPVSLDKQQQ